VHKGPSIAYGFFDPEAEAGLGVSMGPRDVSPARMIFTKAQESTKENSSLCAPWKGAITQWETDPPGTFRSSR
jgi:hypothetical protein